MTLQLNTDGALVTNSGTINDAPAVQINANSVQLTNSSTGRLTSTSALSAAITVQGAGTTITNQSGGVISAFSAAYTAIQGSALNDTVINSGTITGWSRLGDGSDSFTQRGAVSSTLNVDLGDGDDVYRHETTSSTTNVQIYGGNGFDRLQLATFSSSLYGFGFSGFEQLEVSRGTNFWNLSDFNSYQSVVLSTGGSYNFLNSRNPDADLTVDAGSLIVGRSSTFRDVVGLSGNDSVTVENATIRNASLGAGDDTFTISQKIAIGGATVITGTVDGGSGSDMLTINVDGGATVDASKFTGFELLDSGTYTTSVDNYRLINASGFTSFAIGFRDTVVIANSNLASTPVSLAYNVSLTIDATALVGALTLNGGSAATTGDATKFITIVNNGTVNGAVNLGFSNDTYDGRGGMVTGSVYGWAGDDYLRGGAGAEQLFGGNGNDRLEGGAGNDALWGDAGNDVLDGGLGSDSLQGGAGDDTYIVDGGDLVGEAANAGIDTVQSSVNWQLGANVENLTLTGTAQLGTGNAMANIIIGNAADNMLDGNGGDDRLQGGAGNDQLNATKPGNAVLVGGAGNDILIGNGSSTLAVFSGNRSDYAFALDDEGNLLVQDLRGGSPDGTDRLTAISSLQFADGTVALAAVLPNQAPTAVRLANTVPLTAENGLAVRVADVSISDDGRGSNNLSLSGADAASFELRTNAQGGVELWFLGGADAETRTSFQVQVNVDDPSIGGTVDASAQFSLAISDVNERAVTAPMDMDGPTGGSIDENATGLVGITARAADGDLTMNRVTYGLVASDGSVASSVGNLVIDANTGEVRAFAAFDREALGADGLVQLVVRATSEDGSTADSVFTIAVANINEGLVFTSEACVAAGENGLAVGTLSARDVDGDVVTYSIVGGADGALFTIDPQTGALAFRTAPNFEAPSDADADNRYEVVVRASDGSLFVDQTASINVANQNEGQTFTSSAALTAIENSTDAGMVAASDVDGDAIAYSIVGGSDAAQFTIDPQTGALSFRSAPSFEAPGDTDGDNRYEVVVRASDGSLFTDQTASIVVTNQNEGQTFVSPTDFTTRENGMSAGIVAASDLDGDVVTYSIAGGADAALFVVDPQSGALSFRAAPDFEAPSDVDGDNRYEVVVRATDGSLSSTQAVTVSIGNENEGVAFTSASDFAVNENNSVVGIATAVDGDGDAVRFTIVGGDDAAKFVIDASTGVLSFVSQPNFESPTDTDGDNVYQILVRASDGSLGATQALSIRVTNVNEGQVFSSPAAFFAQENSTAVGTVAASDADHDAITYAIVGGSDAAGFSIDAVTGALSFVTPPNFELPSDADGNNVYEIVVHASDGSWSTNQAVTVAVANVNEAPLITSSGGADGATLVIAENNDSVATLTATDPEGTTLTWSIAGGADAARFVIDPSTGTLRFTSAPDFEAPQDGNGDNIYQVVVRASDGSLVDTQALSIRVNNVNEAPVITSNNGANSAALNVAENSSTVITFAASDPEGMSQTWSIAGGADAARFVINPSTGLLSFVSSPNFEAPADSNGDNIYQVIIQSSDGTLVDTQSLAISVTNVNEAPAITTNGGADSATVNIAENNSVVATFAATDPEGGARTWTIAGGSDASRFVINSSTGVLSFLSAPNYEAPSDSNGDNVYHVIVQASDGSLVDTQALAINVTNVNDGLTINGTNKVDTLTGSSAEDTIYGLGGNDTLNGLAGADVIDGGDGSDTINGGLGRDVLTGGAGSDTFVFSSLADSTVSAADVITDFATTEKISLSAIDANANVAGDQAFTWIGTANFSGVAGQLHYSQSGGHTYISGDVNGDGQADFAIQLDPLVVLGSSNFVL